MNTPHPQTTLFEDQKPVRVTVPVRPEVLAAFQRLAAAQGVSTGKAMGEWLADTMEGVDALVDLLEKARKAPKLAAREIHSYALGLTDLTSELLEEVSKRSRKGVPGPARGTVRAAGSAAEGAPPRGEGAAARKAAARKTAPLTPPVGNTGGKVPKKPKKAG